MGKNQVSFLDLAAYRELTAEQQRELLDRLPGSEELLAAYKRQDQLLAALPQPQIPARAIGRIWEATAGATRVERPGFTWRRAVPALVVLLLVAMLGGTGYAAAESLPGEGLYGVKRAGEQVRLAMMTRQETRLAYERHLAERRRVEIQALLARGRQGVPVAFTGLLQQGVDGAWTVAGLPVALPPDAQLMADREVRIEGWTEDGRVQAHRVSAQITPGPTPYPGPTGAPQASPTGPSATRTPQAAPSGSAAPTGSPTGAGEPQYRQGGTATMVPTMDESTPTLAPARGATTRVQSATPQGSRTPGATPTTQQRIGQTATATGGHTPALNTPEPKDGAGPTAAPKAPAVTPAQRGEPQPTSVGDGAGHSDPSTTPAAKGSDSGQGKP
jgi:hypothetical protein